jgi:hypothetical protein
MELKMKLFPCLFVGLCLLAPTAFAASPSVVRDVPSGFWAAPAVQSVVRSGLMRTNSAGDFEGNKPVTRYELAVVLARLVHQMEAAHKPLSALPPVRVSVPKSTPVAAAHALKQLIGEGFLPKNTPLLTKPGTQPVTADELADALSQVTIQISSRSLPADKND